MSIFLVFFFFIIGKKAAIRKNIEFKYHFVPSMCMHMFPVYNLLMNHIYIYNFQKFLALG